MSKVINMKKIQEKTQIPSECVFLIDDRPENIEAVKLAGFSGILVDEKYGIRHDTVDSAKKIIDKCTVTSGSKFYDRHRLRLAIIIAIIILLLILCFL